MATRRLPTGRAGYGQRVARRPAHLDRRPRRRQAASSVVASSRLPICGDRSGGGHRCTAIRPQLLLAPSPSRALAGDPQSRTRSSGWCAAWSSSLTIRRLHQLLLLSREGRCLTGRPARSPRHATHAIRISATRPRAAATAPADGIGQTARAGGVRHSARSRRYALLGALPSPGLFDEYLLRGLGQPPLNAVALAYFTRCRLFSEPSATATVAREPGLLCAAWPSDGLHQRHTSRNRTKGDSRRSGTNLDGSSRRELSARSIDERGGLRDPCWRDWMATC